MNGPARNAPLSCKDCHGSGTGVIWSYSIYATSDGIEAEFDCATCEGTGVRKCEACGESPAVGLDSSNNAVCENCWWTDAREMRQLGGSAGSPSQSGTQRANGGDSGGMGRGSHEQQYAKPSSKSRTESDRVRA